MNVIIYYNTYSYALTPTLSYNSNGDIDYLFMSIINAGNKVISSLFDMNRKQYYASLMISIYQDYEV